MKSTTNTPSARPTADAAETARFEHERLTSLVNSMVDGVIAVNQDAVIDLYNGAALNILDVNGSIEGKSIGAVCELYDANNQPVDIVELIRSTRTSYISRDYSLHYNDGSSVDLYLSIAPVHLGYGRNETQSFVIVLRDISHEKSLEAERDEFISVVSHELRTPITIAEGNISNAQYIIEKFKGSEEIKKALDDAHQQTLFLADMINDLSTLSRAERGTLSVQIESINIHELLDELTRIYRPEIEAKGLRLHTELDRNLELLASAKLYVREVLQNLVTNAIKYTDKGHITIGARAYDKGVMIWVEDSGIGISKSDQEKIYDKFFRAENYETRKTNGTGLGLYVTMKLARLLHADITTKSTLGKGSKFSVYLPNLQ